jgi:hypothetical protein
LELPRNTVRLKFDKGYTIDDIKTSFDIGFGSTRRDAVIELREGMTETEIMEARGLPDTRLVFEGKTVLIYGNLKLILLANKLIDAI